MSGPAPQREDLLRALHLLGFALLMLGGCQYDFTVRAERRGADYVLIAPYTAGRFAPHTCVRRLAVLEGDEVIWEIDNEARGWPHEGRDCAATDFPIVYGTAPAGYRTVVPARPLSPDGRYRIAGGGISPYHGRFTVRADLTVDNQSGR